MSLIKEIETAINKYSAENGSDTPDFILAEYLIGCLNAFDIALTAREKWYGREIKGEFGHYQTTADTDPCDPPESNA